MSFLIIDVDVSTGADPMLELEVLGQPIAQPRHRCSRGRMYIPANHQIHAYKASITLAGQLVMQGRRPLEGAVHVRVGFYLQAPKRPAHKYPSASDIDNLEKAVFDSLNGIFWKDDRQIVAVLATKEYSANPRTTLQCDVVT